ncbi:CRAL-TRIO domain-containing protein [Cladochytrium replicatum]|nr:CRAL-TRIO domain-containing protein [Cladochytrium replicatum]
MAATTASAAADNLLNRRGSTDGIIIAEAIAQYRTQIDELKAACADMVPSDPPEPYDDLFFLRFLLTYKGSVAEALAIVRRTITWRLENADVLKRIREGTGGPLYDEKVSLYSVSSLHGSTVDGNHPVFIIRTGLTDVKLILDVAKPEEFLTWAIMQREQYFAVCDAATRRTGRLVKAFIINDFRGARISWSLIDSRIMKISGSAGREGDLYYPQLLAATVVVNAPSVALSFAFGIFRSFLPDNTQKLMLLCPAANASKPDISKCPFASKLLDPNDVPTFLGGKCVCPASSKWKGGKGDIGKVLEDRGKTTTYRWVARDSVGGCVRGVDNRRQKPLAKDEPLQLKVD